MLDEDTVPGFESARPGRTVEHVEDFKKPKRPEFEYDHA